ncbi:uncharacterized protein LOC129809511 isoform X3 [Phlebotomus papatasi]|nr:uncharacterized protein LOC129809511 isoform X3 [Phlebotomus papatasi]
MDEVKHREKVKELQDKYIPFLEHFIKKLKDANEERSREAQLKKIQSLYDLLKNRPKTLKCDVLEKTERVLMNLYEKFGRGYSHEHKTSESKSRDEPDNSKAVALRPNLEVEVRDKDPAHLDLGVVKQKLLQVKDVPQDRGAESGSSAPSLSVLKQKASAIIGDKVRPVDPRLERRAVTSEITLQVNRISTVISSRNERNAFDPRRDAVPPEGFPIPLANFQGGSSAVNLFCRRTQDKTFFQRRYPPQIEGPSHMPFNNAPSHGGPLPICQGRPDNSMMRPDMNILNSPPLSNDDIQSLMGEPDKPQRPSSGNTTTVSHSDTFRLALKYQPHSSRKPHEKPSTHLPIDPSGSITVSLDDPRLKKPIPPRNDPRRDPRINRHEPPQTTISRYESRKIVDVRSSEYVCNNPPPPKKSFNPMERRSELDDDDYMEPSEQYVAIKSTKNDLAERKKFDKSRAIESAPIEKKSSESSEIGSKSQFDDMYRKNDFSKDYDKHVKNINMGIKDFKIPKKTSAKSESESEEKSKPTEKSDEKKKLTKDKKQENFEEKSIDESSQEGPEKKKKKKKKKQIEKEEKDEKLPEKHVSKASEVSKTTAAESIAESEQPRRKSSRKRIKIIDIDSETDNSDFESETLVTRKARLSKKVKADKINKFVSENASKSREVSPKEPQMAVSEEKNDVEPSNYPQRSKTSTPEPVSSSSQVEAETSGKCETTDSTTHATNTETEAPKDGVTKEWLESVLSNLFNPNMLTKDKLLGIMKNVLDEKKFEQVKHIVESDDDNVENKEEPSKEKEQKAESVPEKPEATIESSTDPPAVETPAAKPAKKKPQKKNRELDRLNEDIRTMFISEGVLTATGRRMCTELQRKSVCYNETTPPTSPTRMTKVKTPEVSSPSKSQSATTKAAPRKTRKKKQAAEETTEESTENGDSLPKKCGESLDDDIAKRFFEEKQLDISRRLKVELQKLKESEIPKNSGGKKGKKKTPKKNVEETSPGSDRVSPKKKKIRRNNIWFRGLKKKVKSSRVAAVIQSEYPPSADFIDLPEPPIKKRPGPKSKTQPTSTETTKESEAVPAPMDIDHKVIKKEKTIEASNIKNNDVNIDAVNHKNCKICGYSGKALVSHYVKMHSLNEVYCARLPKNISEFLKKNEKGMLYAESYNMKLQYTGSKVFGHCIFCREEMYEPPNRWITHFTKHTGEYEYICSCGQKSWNLKVIRTHVKKCEERGSYVANEIMQDHAKCIQAYMCGGCNFIQLLEENTRNHIITEHESVPEVHIVTLLNFSDISVKENHPIFLDMYKQNMAMMDENQDGVFKATDEKDNENSASKSILADISKTIPNEPGSGITSKLHERFGEKPVIKSEAGSVFVKTEKPTTEEYPTAHTTARSEDTSSIQSEDTLSAMSQNTEVPDSNSENPIEPDDDEWEDIDSDSDESVMSQPGKCGPNKKLNRLVQKIGIKTSIKRKSDCITDTSASKKTKSDAPIQNISSNEQTTTTTITPSSSAVSPEVNRSGKVENLQYKCVDGQIIYYCLLQKCLFIGPSMDTFIDHLLRVHDDDKWSGHCNLCHDDKLLNPGSMILEFHHLVNDHIWKENTSKLLPVPQEDIKEEARPAIRLRRLSGDKLSAQMEQDNAFKIPTTPTNIRSITIRRVSRSPDKPASSSPGPSIVTAGTLSSSPGSLVITRAQTVEAASSSSGVPLSTSSTPPLRISTIDSLQTLKSLASPVPKATGNSDDAPRIINLQLGSQITARRSTIPVDLQKSLVENELKPWTKQPCSKPAHIVAKMLTKEVLCSSFKCMGSECWYTTMNEIEMVTHLKSHDKMIEDQLEKTTISDTCSWLECAYCDYMAGSTFELMSHLKKEHLHCEYLCPNCFYRACNATYVTRHLIIHHNSNAKVWQIKADYKSSPTENPVSCVKENVKLLMCKTCNLKFLNYNHFENHIKDHASQVFECVFCSAMIRIENMKKHMFCHSIGNYECIYCECATVNKNNLAQHMCDRHQNKVLLYYNREEVQEHVAKFKLSPFDDFCTSRVITEFITKESLTKSIQKIPVGISVVRHTSSASTVNSGKEKAPAAETPNQSSMPLVISNVVSLHAQPQSSVSPAPQPSVSPAPQSSLVIKDVCTLSKDTPSTKPATPVASGSRSVEPSATGGSIKADVSSNSVVLEGVTVSKEAFEQQSFGFSTSLSRVIADWVAKSGVPQVTLLKCAECGYQAKGRGDFMEHVDRSHTNTLLKCSQCVNVFWHSSKSLWIHLETHGYKRYFCFMCDYTGRSEKDVADHCTKTVHKWLGYSLVLITPAIESGIFLLCPKNTKFEEIERFKADFVRTIQRLPLNEKRTGDGAVRNDKEVPGRDSYGPDDVDQLPTKPVVAKNIFCKLCNYKTMIVKNLVRHFEAHRQAAYVPNLDPINPVPCLSEKNFDKMTNLACSSNMDSRCKGVNEPVFVMQQKRFVCGVEDCSYITIDDVMLKYHLSTLHSNETSYKCPHCKTELLKGSFSVETIVMHYRLHGPRLYMCDKCQYMNETTTTVEKHIKTVHSGVGNIYVLRDESKSETPVVAESAPQGQDEALPKKWQCNECSETSYLKTDMNNHVMNQHGAKYQYICGYCSMGHHTRSYVEDHVNMRHGGKMIIRETYSAIKGVYIPRKSKRVEKPEDSVNFWRRDENGAKSIRGIPCESQEILPRTTEEEEEEFSDEDINWDSEIPSMKAVETEIVKRKPEQIDLVMQVKRPRVERIIQCTICGKTTKSALTMQVVHFPECHPGVAVSTRVITSTCPEPEPLEETSKKEPVSLNGFYLKCYHCSEMCSTVALFQKHYIENHTEEEGLETVPCWYHAIKTMYCGLCQEVCDTYDEISKHMKDIHKTESVIAKSIKGGMVCGACDYDAGDDQNLLRHAKLRHTKNTYKQVISQVTLDQLLHIEMFPMKRCTACREIVIDIDGRQSEEHLRTKHSASVIATFVAIRNPTYICSSCHQIFDSETTFYTHTLTHVESFKCSACSNFFLTYENALEHINETHTEDTPDVQFTWPTEEIIENHMVFPNGLVMTLEELQLTKYRFDQSKFKIVRNEVVRKLKITTSELVI